MEFRPKRFGLIARVKKGVSKFHLPNYKKNENGKETILNLIFFSFNIRRYSKFYTEIYVGQTTWHKEYTFPFISYFEKVF